MSLRQIAVKDFRDGMREWSLYVYVGLLAVAGLALGYFYGRSASSATMDSGTATQLTGLVAALLTFVVPIAGLGLSQNSIVGKRTSGELKVLLGLPFSRRDLLLGTFLGRSAIVSLGVVAMAVGVAVTAIAQGVPLDVVQYPVTMGSLVVLGFAFVAVGIAVSATVRNTTWSAVIAFGVFFVIVFPVWDLFPTGVAYLVNGFSMPEQSPEWANAFRNLEPITALGNFLVGVFDGLRSVLSGLGVRAGESPPVYQQPWFGALVVLAWILGPLLAGYWRFQGSDL